MTLPTRGRAHRPARPTTCLDCVVRSDCPLGKLPAAQMDLLRPWVREHGFRRGEVLQRQGHNAQTIRVIKSGAALLYRDGRDGQSRSVGIAAQGHVLGLPGLFDHVVVMTTVAISEGRVCELGKEAIPRDGVHDHPAFRPCPVGSRRLEHAQPARGGRGGEGGRGAIPRQGLLDDPAFRHWLVGSLMRSMSNQADWAQVARAPGVVCQLAGALLQLGALQRSERIRMPGHAVLAELLGITRESVARGLARLEDKGGITRVGRTYCELHGERLQACAGGERPPVPAPSEAPRHDLAQG